MIWVGHVARLEHTHNFCRKLWKGKDHLGDLGTDGRVKTYSNGS